MFSNIRGLYPSSASSNPQVRCDNQKYQSTLLDISWGPPQVENHQVMPVVCHAWICRGTVALRLLCSIESLYVTKLPAFDTQAQDFPWVFRGQVGENGVSHLQQMPTCWVSNFHSLKMPPARSPLPRKQNLLPLFSLATFYWKQQELLNGSVALNWFLKKSNRSYWQIFKMVMLENFRTFLLQVSR